MLGLVAGYEAAVGGDDPPPGQVVPRFGQEPTNRPRRTREAGLGGDLAVGHHLTRRDAQDDGLGRWFERRHVAILHDRDVADPWSDCRWARDAVAVATHGVLGTAGPTGDVRLVPIVFALADDVLVGAVDHKPKSTTRLARLADIARTGKATLLVEHYEDDWSRLWWVRMSGPAAVVEPEDERHGDFVELLVAKYPQYAEHRPAGPCYTVGVEQVAAWRATEG